MLAGVRIDAFTAQHVSRTAARIATPRDHRID